MTDANEHRRVVTLTLWAVLTFDESHDGRGSFVISLVEGSRFTSAEPPPGIRLELASFTGRRDDAASYIARFLSMHPGVMVRCSAHSEIKALFNLG